MWIFLALILQYGYQRVGLIELYVVCCYTPFNYQTSICRLIILHYAPDLVDLMNEIAVKFARKWQDIGQGLGLERNMSWIKYLKSIDCSRIPI